MIEDFLDCESRVNLILEREGTITLSLYDCRSSPTEILTDNVCTHPHIVYKKTVCPTFYFTPPAECMHSHTADRDVKHILETLVDRTTARAELRETVEKLEESNDRLNRSRYIASQNLKEPLGMVPLYLRLLENKHADELSPDAQE